MIFIPGCWWTGIVFLGTPIDDMVSNVIIAQLLFLQMSRSEKGTFIFISILPGGSVTAGLAIYDTHAVS